MVSNQITQMIDRLVEAYKYKKLPMKLSADVRAAYVKYAPMLDCSSPIYSINNELIADSFTRFVTGDYGMYVEFSPYEAHPELYRVAHRQEFRLKPSFFGKYEWWTTKSGQPKIYKQIKGVSYADYKPGMYYISVYDVKVI